MVRARPTLPAGHGEVVERPAFDEWAALMSREPVARDGLDVRVRGSRGAGVQAAGARRAAGRGRGLLGQAGRRLGCADARTSTDRRYRSPTRPLPPGRVGRRTSCSSGWPERLAPTPSTSWSTPTALTRSPSRPRVCNRVSGAAASTSQWGPPTRRTRSLASPTMRRWPSSAHREMRCSRRFPPLRLRGISRRFATCCAVRLPIRTTSPS